MPKNKGKGGKNRRRGKNENDNEKRELTFKEDGQEYAQVVKMLGYVLSNPLLPSIFVSDASARSTLRCTQWLSTLPPTKQDADVRLFGDEQKRSS